jgi:release factor glutamine methyltransferase
VIAGANGVTPGETPRTVLDYLRRATVFFAGRGIETARLDAEVLLAAVLATGRVEVYLRFDQPLGAAEVVAYRELVRRRGAGEPVAYLTGRREFWSRDLRVTPAVLIPRPETEILVEHALGLVGDRGRPLRVLDLGTGSGALAVVLAAELPAAQVLAIDISPAAAAVAHANVAAADLADRATVIVADWTTPLAAGARFDLIVCNPPYVESGALAALAPEVRCEPTVALDGGPDGLAAYRTIAPAAAALLAPAGHLVLEVGLGQADAVGTLVRAAGLATPPAQRDLAGIERVVAGAA